jgi:hypothetical protein
MMSVYLVWSHEHGAWWGPGGCGYTPKLSQAGRYSRADALMICTRAIPGTAAREGSLPELPVRLDDLLDMLCGPHGEIYEPGLGMSNGRPRISRSAHKALGRRR